MVIYCLIKCNRPIINSQIVLPSLLTGILWACGQSAFFVANEKLSEAVSFPMITRVCSTNITDAIIMRLLYFAVHSCLA